MNTPRIVSVGTTNPPKTYTQQELVELFKADDPRLVQFFTNSHIKQRHLILPEPDGEGNLPDEDGEALLNKHRHWSVKLGAEAVEGCMSGKGLTPQDVDFLVTVTTTGMLCPSLSSLVSARLDMRRDVQRIDLVGMGCNGGMNGLFTVARFAKANPGANVVLLSAEICSAGYVFDMTMRTAVVNSLFGDAVAAVLVRANEEDDATDGARLLDFESYLVSEVSQEMRYDFEDGRWTFYLGRDIPYAIGAAIEKPINALLERNNMKRREISHWIVHSGGKKVVDSIKYNIGLTDHDIRHTKAILRNYGNISSSAFLFAYQELMREGVTRKGDFGVTIAMGPGVSIETGLLQW
jgi:3,5-dihydroxyphenylacetyl-CoA synthase